jgi:hypothetical protein
MDTLKEVELACESHPVIQCEPLSSKVLQERDHGAGISWARTHRLVDDSGKEKVEVLMVAHWSGIRGKLCLEPFLLHLQIKNCI